MSAVRESEVARERAKRKQRIEAARAPFWEWIKFSHLKDYGLGVTAFKRAEKAQWAVQNWRDANNQRRDSAEQLRLAIRIAADTFASQIESAGQGRYDDAAIRWVVAGLRCTSAPFCTGCEACQTVTSPERVTVDG